MELLNKTALKQGIITLTIVFSIFAFTPSAFAQTLDPGLVQTSSTEIAPAGVIQVISTAVEGSVQSGTASVDEVVSVAQTAIESGTPPGQVVNITNYATRIGLDSDQIIIVLQYLADLIAEGMAPGQASNAAKDCADRIADDAASCEEEPAEAEAASSEESEETDSSQGNGNGNGGGNGGGNGNGNGNGGGNGGGNGNGNGNGGGNGGGNGNGNGK